MIKKEDIKKLSLLARIEIPDGEIGHVRENLGKILDFFSNLKKAPFGETEQEPDRRNVMREDEEPHKAAEYSEDLLKQAPKLEKGYVKVKKIL